MDIASLLEVQVDETPPSSSSAPDCIGKDTLVKEEQRNIRPSEIISEEEKQFRQLIFGHDIAKVRFRRLHCTSCNNHIGSAPSEAYNMHEHPVLKVLLCAACREFYGDGAFEQGDDATDMFCRWCANGGNLYCCSYCSNTFCQKCIRLNFDIEVRKKIEAEEKWKCFACEPGPLYLHRAVCWALLLHVKTLTRILSADCTMTPKEMLSKMEQDDTSCCLPQRAKRKRKSTNSSSEEEFSASSVAGNGSKDRKRLLKRRRSVGSKSSVSNEITESNGQKISKIVVDRDTKNNSDSDDNKGQRGDNSNDNDDGDDDDDITSLLNPEQTMIEDESVIIPSINTSSHVIVGKSHVNMLSRSTGSQGTRMLVPIHPLRKINALPFGATPKLIKKLPALPKRSKIAPMVSIPSRPLLITKSGASKINTDQSLKLRSKNYVNIMRIDKNRRELQAQSTTPSVIDLESDSDDGNTQNSNSPGNNITISNNDDSEMRELQNSSTQSEMPDSTCTRLTLENFNRNVNNPLRVIDEIFKKLRKKLKNDIFKFERNGASSEINAVKNKLRIINRNISKIVSELSLFNNTMIKQYEPWKDSRLNGKIPDDSIEIINLKKGDNSHRIIPLEMECECDSESDRNCDTEPDTNDDEYLPINYSNRLLEFKHKETIDQFCTAKVQTQDKAIQVYDNCSIDYDMKIGYSLLMKADFDPDQNKEVFKPVIIEDPFFDKYEEQFIFYLQSLEEQSCHDDGDEEKENASPEEKSLTDIIDYDLSIEKINEPIHRKITFNQPENFDGNVSEIDEKSLNIETSIDINQLIDLDPKTRNDEAADSEQESPLQNNSEISTMSTNVDEIRHEETATAVEALMEVQPQLNSNLSAHHKRDSNLCEDDDECTILD